MSPLRIEMLLHIHCRNEPIDNLHDPKGAQREAINWFLAEDLIEPSTENESAYQLLPRGQAFVDYLYELPLPVMTWAMPLSPPPVD